MEKEGFLIGVFKGVTIAVIFFIGFFIGRGINISLSRSK